MSINRTVLSGNDSLLSLFFFPFQPGAVRRAAFFEEASNSLRLPCLLKLVLNQDIGK